MQHRQQGGEEGQARDVGDDHADARDQPQFRNAAKLRRQEREEAGQQRHGGERQRPADAPARGDDRVAQMLLVVALGAVAHRELDAEVDPKPQKQRREGDRDRVELAHHEEADARRDDQAGERRRQHRENHAPGAQREKEDEGDGGDGQRRVEGRILCDRCEFVAFDGSRACQAHAHAPIRRQPEVCGGVSDQIEGGCGGLQGVIVEFRLDEDEAPQLARFGLAAGQKLPPGQAGRPAGQNVLEGLCERRHRSREFVEGRFSGAHALRAELERLHDAAQAWIGRERSQKTLLPDELLGGAGQLVDGQEQKAVLVEERTAVGPPHALQTPGCPASAWASLSADSSAISGVSPSTTATMRPTLSGRPRHIRESCRQGTSDEISRSVLVLMAKRVTVT